MAVAPSPGEPAKEKDRKLLGRIERTARVIAGVLLSGPVLGAALGGAAFSYELATRPEFSVFGKSHERLESLVFGRYGAQVKQDQVDILIFMLATGALLGVLAALVRRLVESLSSQSRPLRLGGTPWATLLLRGAATSGLVLLAHLLWAARSIIGYPQLYAESMYARGGLRRGVQLLLTDHVPLSVIDGAIALLVLGALAAAVVGLMRARASGRPWTAIEPATFAGTLLLGVLLGASLLRMAPPTQPAGATPRSAAAQPGSGGPAQVTLPSGEQANLLIIGVDSLRADRLFPQRNDLTPHINALARKGLTFTAAFTSLPRTFPSWVSILTGRLPQTHGIRNMFPTWEDRQKLPPALPHALRQAGYRTQVISDYAGDIFSRVDLGFSEVWTPTFTFGTLVSQRGLEIHSHAMPYANTSLGRRAFPILREFQTAADADRLTDDVVLALRRMKSGERFAMTVFYSAAHFPYAAPYPHYRRHTDAAYRGEYKYHIPNPLDATDPLPADVRQARMLYDGAVGAVDVAIGRLLTELERQGKAEKTIVVLLADHGESIFEPGRGMGHGNHLRGDESIRVPLVIYDPRLHQGGKVAPRVIPALVRDIDLAPTLASLLGLPRAALGDVDGTDLGPLLRGEKDDLGLSALAETGLWFVTRGAGFAKGERIPYPNITELTELDARHGDEVVLKQSWRRLTDLAKHRMLRTRTHKLIYVPTRSGVRYELYDVKADPDERHDLAQAEPELLARLKRELETLLRRERGVELVAGFALPGGSGAASP